MKESNFGIGRIIDMQDNLLIRVTGEGRLVDEYEGIVIKGGNYYPIGRTSKTWNKRIATVTKEDEYNNIDNYSIL